jgi:capsule biosynthesis phosphatase
MIALDKVLVVDVDGTLCPIKPAGAGYEDLPVHAPMRDKLNALAADGWRIVLNSARGMRTYDGNGGEIAVNVLPVLHRWLRAHDVPFHELHMAKPWAGRNGFYVDDRAVRPREFLENDVATLEALCARDRSAG